MASQFLVVVPIEYSVSYYEQTCTEAPYPGMYWIFLMSHTANPYLYHVPKQVPNYVTMISSIQEIQQKDILEVRVIWYMGDLLHECLPTIKWELLYIWIDCDSGNPHKWCNSSYQIHFKTIFTRFDTSRAIISDEGIHFCCKQ